MVLDDLEKFGNAFGLFGLGIMTMIALTHVICVTNVCLMPVVVIPSRSCHQQNPYLAAVRKVALGLVHKCVGRSYDGGDHQNEEETQAFHYQSRTPQVIRVTIS